VDAAAGGRGAKASTGGLAAPDAICALLAGRFSIARGARKNLTLRTCVVNFQSVRSYQLYQFYRGCRGSPYTQNPFYITLLEY
jgi:hypothetical protein